MESARQSASVSTGTVETPIVKLPIWQRQKVSELRERRDEIYLNAVVQAEEANLKSPSEKKEWVKNWREGVRAEIRSLRLEEAEVRRNSRLPLPDQDEIAEFIVRLKGRDPILGEPDLVVISHLLTPVNRFKRERESDDLKKMLLEAYHILADEYPQSANFSTERILREQ